MPRRGRGVPDRRRGAAISRHNRGADVSTAFGRPPIPAKLENAIREALNKPGRLGVRKIAERFGVDPGTVQRISRPRPRAASVVV
jgi:hypothetical protein